MHLNRSDGDSNIRIVGGNEVLFPGLEGDYPVVIRNDADPRLSGWLSANRTFIDNTLTAYGAILFKGFCLKDVHGFKELLPGLFREEIAYKERSSPRHPVMGNIYSSTDHPDDQVIHMHNESSYASVYPGRICFYAQIPPLVGGETPIADVRKVALSIDPDVIMRFRRSGVRYVRNILPGIGLTWKETFQVNSKTELERTLALANMNFEWVSDDHLRITWTRPAFHQHPVSREWVWFNHVCFYSKYLIDDYILEMIPDEDLPFLSYYGDGGEIEREVTEQIKDAYQRHSILFKWEKDDLLLLDNMLVAHGRMPFKGERKLLVAMGDPIHQNGLN